MVERERAKESERERERERETHTQRGRERQSACREREKERAHLDHDHGLAGDAEGVGELLEGASADDLLVLTPALDELVYLGGGPVEDRHRVSVVGHVEHLGHVSQSAQINIKR